MSSSSLSGYRRRLALCAALALSLALAGLLLMSAGVTPLSPRLWEVGAAGPAGTLTLRVAGGAAALTTLSEGNPWLVSGPAGRVTIGWSHRPAIGERRALARFDLAALPAGAQVLSARLTARVESWAGLPTLEAAVAPVLEPWSAEQVTWARQPALGPAGPRARLGRAGRVEWLITDLAREWLARPESNYGVMLVSLAGYPEDNERTLADVALELTLAAAGPCEGERVVNGGFESFTDGWELAGVTLPSVSVAQRHAGDFSIQLGVPAFEDVAGDSIIMQTVRIPADAAAAALSFWYKLDSGENDPRFDWFEASVLDAYGRTVTEVLRIGASADWTQAGADLSALRGQVVTLRFRVHNDGNAGLTIAYLDDVSLCAPRPAGAEPTATPYPGLCALAGGWPDYAPAGLPDFSARQSDWLGADGNWSHDGPAAAADVLWWLDSMLEPGSAAPPAVSDGYALVSAYGAWDDHAPDNVAPLVAELAARAGPNARGARGTEPHALADALQAYVAERGLAGQIDVRLAPAPTFDALRQSATAGEGAVLLLGFYQWTPAGWRRLGGRYVALAGAGCATDVIAISDPLRDAAELGRPGDVRPAYPSAPASGGWEWGHAGAPDAVHNDAGWLSHDVYELAQMDDGWGLLGYALRPADVTESLGHNIPAGVANGAAHFNPAQLVMTRVEYAVIVGRRPATATAAERLPGAEVTLRVELQGRPTPPAPAWSAPLLACLRRPGDLAPRAAFSVTTDFYGAARLGAQVTPGAWDVAARAGNTLSAGVSATLNAGPNDVALGVLPAGDANADNRVAVEDVSLLAAAYATQAGDAGFDARADFNGDQRVDDRDLALLRQNLGRLGDAPWEAGPAGNVALTLLPSDTKTTAGLGVFPISIVARAYGQEVDAIEVHLSFDPAILQVVDEQGRPATEISATAALSDVVINRVDNLAGKVDLVLAQLQPPAATGELWLGQLWLKALAPAAETWLRFASEPGRRSDVARTGRSVLQSYQAARIVSAAPHRVELPLIYRRR
jgi:hypothetical protein